mgnify:CR=1 FL=1
MNRLILILLLFALFPTAGKSQTIKITNPVIFPPYFNHTNDEEPYTTSSFYRVKLKNDSIIKIFGEINLSENIHCLLIKEKEKTVGKIYANETYYINYLVLGANTGIIANTYHDSCWLFQQTYDDSILLYSFIPNYDSKFATYFKRSNEDKLYVINKENLLPYVGNDYELLSLIRREKYIKAIKLINKKLNTRYTILKN